MPNMSGLDLCQTLRTLPGGAHDHAHRSRWSRPRGSAMRVGAYDYLQNQFVAALEVSLMRALAHNEPAASWRACARSSTGDRGISRAKAPRSGKRSTSSRSREAAMRPCLSAASREPANRSRALRVMLVDASCRAVRRDQLCCDACITARERAVRARARRVHGCQRVAPRTVRASRRGHDLSRRVSGRCRSKCKSSCCACCRAHRTCSWRRPRSADCGARRGLDQSRSRGCCRGSAISCGSLLSHQRGRDPSATVAQANLRCAHPCSPLRARRSPDALPNRS